MEAPESPGTWPWVDPTQRRPRGSRAPAFGGCRLLHASPGPSVCSCPKRNCPDHDESSWKIPKHSGAEKIAPGRREPQECLPVIPPPLTDYLKQRPPNLYHPGLAFTEDNVYTNGVDDFGMIRSTLHLLCTLFLLLLASAPIPQIIPGIFLGSQRLGTPAYIPDLTQALQTFIPATTSGSGSENSSGNEENEWKLFFLWGSFFLLLE